ncbi:MAG: RNA 3'-terminal phosphate cyclase [Anaerolineales bacterium]
MPRIDGNYGEGGGQILRTGLTLACITGLPLELHNIRAGRKKPGLRPQHLACVRAAADICKAEVRGGEVGSRELYFLPKMAPKPGHYRWQIGTAGAATLVLQTVMLPLAMAPGPSAVHVEGGTHVPHSPTAHYLRDVYIPMLIQSGAEVEMHLERLGWYPKGGGALLLQTEGWAHLSGQNLLERGDLERVFGVGLASNLAAHIPQRLSDHSMRLLASLDVPVDIRVQRDGDAASPGAALCLAMEYANGRAGVSVLGEQGLPAENIAEEAATGVMALAAGGASVDAHLADQLVLLFALADGESAFVTPYVTEHLRTNIWVINRFIQRRISIHEKHGLVEIAG